MIVLKSNEEIAIMRDANRIVADVLAHLKDRIVPGVTTGELDRVAEEMIVDSGGKPAFKGYMGYKHTLCTSVNEEIVHGIPGKRELVEGDIISIDCGILFKEFYGDHAWTFSVGIIPESSKKLLKVCEEALYIGIDKARVGNRLFDISSAVQGHAESKGFAVVRDYVGHGIGKRLHEEPQVPNFGEAGTGLKLRAGLVLALEPMLNEGTWEVELLKDEWTVVTKDRKRSAHFEHSVAITEKGPEILSII